MSDEAGRRGVIGLLLREGDHPRFKQSIVYID